MTSEMFCLKPLKLHPQLNEAEKMKKAGNSKSRFSAVEANKDDVVKKSSGGSIYVMPRHIRLALASYKNSDADVSEDTYRSCVDMGGKKRTRNAPRDVWSRIDSGEIKVQQTIDEWCKNMEPPMSSKVESNIPNYAICTTNMADYSYKSTTFGDVYYSPRFCDNKYIYRFVILTKGVRNEAYRILKSCGRYFLSESQIIHQLGIDLSPGWEHFMVFRSRLDELILRRPIGT